MSLRVSADERCLFCTTSAQTYVSGAGAEGLNPGVDEELRVLWSTCVQCGFTVPTSDGAAKDVHGDLDAVLELAGPGSSLPSLILPPEAAVYYHPVTPEQLVNACWRVGFSPVVFELVGDELVAVEYLRLWKRNGSNRTWIRSTSPIVVEYIRLRHPELVPYLAPIVSPSIATLRYLRFHGAAEPAVHVGVDRPLGSSADRGLLHLTLEGLGELFDRLGVEPRREADTFRRVPPVRRRHLSVPGGLPLAMLEDTPASSRKFRKIRELKKLSGLADAVEEGDPGLGFLDVLAFDGGLDHPELSAVGSLEWRRRIAELAERPRSPEPVVTAPPGLDLSIDHAELDEEHSRIHLHDIVETGDEMGLPLDELLDGEAGRLPTCPFFMGRRYRRALQNARHDALTGLYSYGAFRERLREEVARVNRSGSSLALLLIDLDRFKDVNDTYGHPVGNRLLRRIARATEDTLRRTDIAARFGGDELVVILVGPDAEGTTQVADKIRSTIENLTLTVGSEQVGVTASIGIAYHDGESRSSVDEEALFAEADAALYVVKEEGGNGIHPSVSEELAKHEP